MRKQLTLFNLELFTQPVIDTTYDPSWNETVLEQDALATQQVSNHDSSVLEQESTATNKSAPEHNHWLERYKVTRYGKEHYYYRYVWMSGRKLHHVHISGNAESALAKTRKQMVERAIASGLSPNQISALIKSWKFI